MGGRYDQMNSMVEEAERRLVELYNQVVELSSASAEEFGVVSAEACALAAMEAEFEHGDEDPFGLGGNMDEEGDTPWPAARESRAVGTPQPPCWPTVMLGRVTRGPARSTGPLLSGSLFSFARTRAET